MSEFYTKYNRRPCKGLAFTTPSLVQPQFQRDADINVMIQRALGGDVSVLARGGQMVDVSDAPDSFHELLNESIRCESAWDSLPDPVRHSYGNKEAFLAALDKAVADKAVADKAVADKAVADKSVAPNGASPAEQAEGSIPKSVLTT